MPQSDVLLSMQGICKSFGPVKANDAIDFEVAKGEIHALIGENGAGKTTLMKTLFGLHKPDSGTIMLAGEQLGIDGPKAAMAKGIGMVHQHFMLVPSLTVTENIVLGNEPKRNIFYDFQFAEKQVKRISDEYGLKVDPRAKIRDCAVGIQQRVEIIKALSRGARLLILDEPTAVLTPQETSDLFVVLRQMVKQGMTIVFISHKLKEVLEVSQRITVMRAGKVVGRVATAQTNEEQLASLMVGRKVLLKVEKTAAEAGKSVLAVERLWVSDQRGLPAVRGVSFQVRSGEILGVAGVEGNGQTELVEAICGLRQVEAGKVMKDGVNLAGKTVREIRRLGLAHIPEDRFTSGLCPDASIMENLIGGLHLDNPYSNKGVLCKAAIKEYVEKAVKDYGIKIGSIYDPVKSLSGGNAQKVVIARELASQANLIVASQPTRGVDIGAIEFIHRLIVAKRDEGKGILLISADLQEVLSLSDRLIVLYEGQIVAELSTKQTNEDEVGLYMTGGKRMVAEGGGACDRVS